MTTKFLLSSDDNTRSGLLKKKIIHYYMANGDATIAEVCKEMNLSIPTVTKLISELQEDGYILDFGKQETSGGRKPSIYGLNPASGYFVGVDILKDQRYDGGYRGTRVCGELRTFDGSLPLDLRIHEPCSRYGGRQGKQEVANRG